MYKITLEIEHLPEGPYLGTSPDLPGLVVQGDSIQEVLRLAPGRGTRPYRSDDRDKSAIASEHRNRHRPWACLRPRSRVTYQELTRQLRRLGCELKRQSKGSHEIWHNPRQSIGG